MINIVVFLFIANFAHVVSSDCFHVIDCVTNTPGVESINCSTQQCSNCRGDEFCTSLPVCVDGKCVQCFEDWHCNTLSEYCGGMCVNNSCVGGANCWQVFRSDCKNNATGECEPCQERFVDHECPTSPSPTTSPTPPQTTSPTEFPTEYPTSSPTSPTWYYTYHPTEYPTPSQQDYT